MVWVFFNLHEQMDISIHIEPQRPISKGVRLFLPGRMQMSFSKQQSTCSTQERHRSANQMFGCLSFWQKGSTSSFISQSLTLSPTHSTTLNITIPFKISMKTLLFWPRERSSKVFVKLESFLLQEQRPAGAIKHFGLHTQSRASLLCVHWQSLIPVCWTGKSWLFIVRLQRRVIKGCIPEQAVTPALVCFTAQEAGWSLRYRPSPSILWIPIRRENTWQEHWLPC